MTTGRLINMGKKKQQPTPAEEQPEEESEEEVFVVGMRHHSFPVLKREYR